MTLQLLALYLGVGVFVGFLAGLLGMGGGAVLIPALIFTLEAQHVPDVHVMHQALGTSLACILFGSISSLREHHAHGAVKWDIVVRLTPGILLGGFLGSVLVAHLPTHALKIIFMIFLLYVSTNLLLNIRPKARRPLPGPFGMHLTGFIIGGLGGLVGIGGAAISVPFLTWCNVTMHNAIGTSAALGFPIALIGSIGYAINGYGVPNLPPHSFGYIYLPALIGISAMSILIAPLGAKTAHRLPVKTLRRVFALFLYAVTAKMAMSLL